MLRMTIASSLVLTLVAGTYMFAQQYSVETRKVGKGTVTEINGGGPAPVINGKNLRDLANVAVVHEQGGKAAPVPEKQLIEGDAVSTVIDVQLWLGRTRFIDKKDGSWSLVYGAASPIQPNAIPGWQIRTTRNKDFFFTNDGRLFCFTGYVETELLRKALAK